MSTYADLHHNPAGLGRLRIALLALLPKDGTPKTIAELARITFVKPLDVTDALFDDYMNGALDFNVQADTFCNLKPKEFHQ